MLLHESPIMYDYTCPEGSIVLFTEVSFRLRFSRGPAVPSHHLLDLWRQALTHAGGLWSGDVPRMAIFNCCALPPPRCRFARWC